MKELLTGATSVDITPVLPVSLVGQYYRRLATRVYSKLRAQILAVEGASGSVIFVACDLLGVPDKVQEEIRRAIQKLAPEIPVENVILSAAFRKPLLKNNKKGAAAACRRIAKRIQGNLVPVKL